MPSIEATRRRGKTPRSSVCPAGMRAPKRWWLTYPPTDNSMSSPAAGSSHVKRPPWTGQRARARGICRASWSGGDSNVRSTTSPSGGAGSSRPATRPAFHKRNRHALASSGLTIVTSCSAAQRPSATTKTRHTPVRTYANVAWVESPRATDRSLLFAKECAWILRYRGTTAPGAASTRTAMDAANAAGAANRKAAPARAIPRIRLHPLAANAPPRGGPSSKSDWSRGALNCRMRDHGPRRRRRPAARPAVSCEVRARGGRVSGRDAL